MSRALLISDVRDWAFHINNRGIQKWALYDWEVDHFFYEDFLLSKKLPDWERYDVIFVPHHDWYEFQSVPWERRYGSLRSQYFRMGDPGPATPEEIALINRHRGFHVVNRRSYQELSDVCPRLVYLTNPVDVSWFEDVEVPRDRLEAQWNGNARHMGGRVKGIDLVVTACQSAGVRVNVREFGLNRLAPEMMGLHYATANIAICASLHEGASNSVMEAMASGQALISTDCGNAREMQESQIREFGDSGIVLVERTTAAITKALEDLKVAGPERVLFMGDLNRTEIEDRWSWKAWFKRYRDFFSGKIEEREPESRPENVPEVNTDPSSHFVFYADTPGWAQHIFVDQLARAARTWPGIESASVTTSPQVALAPGDTVYTPVAGAADSFQKRVRNIQTLTGLWSHVSYGGWFTDDPLDPTLLPRTRAHATNLYLYALTGLPYLAGGVNTDLFAPAVGAGDRRKRHQRDPRLVVGWTGSLQYNAAVKLFNDLWIPAVRLAGCDGPIAEAKICARPLPVWDCRDARSPAQVAEYLKGIDVYLCTSISEGCSNSVLEAAASGCVVISTPCGNAPEIAQIVGWNIHEIANAILVLEANRWSLYELQELMRDRVVRYWSWHSKIKKESWRSWLRGGLVPDWNVQLPYLDRAPGLLLEDSREIRQLAVPGLRKGNMYGS